MEKLCEDDVMMQSRMKAKTKTNDLACDTKLSVLQRFHDFTCRRPRIPTVFIRSFPVFRSRELLHRTFFSSHGPPSVKASTLSLCKTLPLFTLSIIMPPTVMCTLEIWGSVPITGLLRQLKIQPFSISEFDVFSITSQPAKQITKLIFSSLHSTALQTLC